MRAPHPQSKTPGAEGIRHKRIRDAQFSYGIRYPDKGLGEPGDVLVVVLALSPSPDTDNDVPLS